ncbi:MAG: AMP-binding protein [Candidatus Nezhaarchaeota archaeon]|nr:AMP-binding protein [Candidatus Nezhaarchaeota archaeon]
MRDVANLPFTTKDDLLASYPYGSLAVDLKEVRLILSSSGTTGRPILTFYTERDYDAWMVRLARNLRLAGVGKGDLFVNTANQALFTGRGYTEAAPLVGAATFPVGPASPEKHLKIMAELGVTAFHAIPSFALKMANIAAEEGLTGKLKLKKAIVGAESWGEATRSRIEKWLNVDAYDNYGVAELGGPGIAIECPAKDGLHVWADHYLVEVVEPDTREEVNVGEEGELVVTTLSREAMPLIRYRTGDVVKLLPSDCSCGLKTPKISRIKGRLNEMVKVRGISLYPKVIEEVISSFNDLTGEYQVLLSGIDDITVRVEYKRGLKGCSLEDFERKIQAKVKELTLLTVKVELVEEGSIINDGKARRLVDMRKL